MGDTWWPTADGGLEYFQHTDERAPFRWSPFRCNELMRDRPWDVIEDFHDRVAAGEASPDDLTPLSENDSDHANAEVLDLHEALDDHVASDNGRNGPNGSGATGNGGNPDGYGASGRLEQLRELDGQEGFVQDKSPDFLRSTVQGNGYSYGCGVSVADSGDTNGRRALLESGDPTGFEPFVSRTNWDGCRPSIVSSGETSGRGAFVKSGDSDGLASSNSGKESEVEGPSEGATPISAKSSERRTFKIELAYSGRHFWGWQKQTGHETVQDSLERALRSVLDKYGGRNGTELDGIISKHNANATVAGRTDRGVSAAGQVVSWYTRCPDVNCENIAEAINREAPGRLRAVHVSQVNRSFHAQFSAKWRHYVYLFSLKGGELQADGRLRMQPPGAAAPHQPRGTVNAIPPSIFSVRLLDGMLRRLEGRSISYGGFARDTRADRSRVLIALLRLGFRQKVVVTIENCGQHVVCHLYKARADVVTVTSPSQSPRALQHALRFTLIGNRFLHRMVRVVVATAIREAAAGSSEDALLRLSSLENRRATAPPAPPEGLTLAAVGYDVFG